MWDVKKDSTCTKSTPDLDRQIPSVSSQVPSGDIIKKSDLEKPIIESENQINDSDNLRSELDHHNNDTYNQDSYFNNQKCGNNEQNGDLGLGPSREGNPGHGTPVTPESGSADVKRTKLRKKRRCKDQNCLPCSISENCLECHHCLNKHLK